MGKVTDIKRRIDELEAIIAEALAYVEKANREGKVMRNDDMRAILSRSS